MDRHPPDLHVTAAVQFEGGVIRIGGLELQPTLMAGQAFEGEATIENRHHHPARSGVEAAVHHQQVTVVDAGTGHGVAAHPQKKRAGGMADQLFIQVDSHFHVVVRRGREPGGHPFAGQGQGQAGALMPQGQRAVPELHKLVCSTSVL